MKKPVYLLMSVLWTWHLVGSANPSDVTPSVTRAGITSDVTKMTPKKETILPAAAATPRDPSMTTNCTNLTPPLVLPNRGPPYQMEMIYVDFGRDNPVNVTCTWLLPARDSNSSNVLAFPDLQEWCHDREIVFYDVDPQTGEKYVIAGSCDGFWPGSGRPGMDTLVVLTASSFPERKTPAFGFLHYGWPADKCPQNGALRVNASTQWYLDLIFPETALRVPSNVSCVWEFQAPEKGVVHLSITSESNFNNPTCAIKDHFIFRDPGSPLMPGPVQVDLCQGMGQYQFQYRALGGTALVSFHSNPSGGAPDFDIQYHAATMDELCPTSQPQDLQAVEHVEDGFKGVNQAPDSPSDKTCRWNITAPTGMVVKLTKLYNVDYLAHCHSGDGLVLGHGDKTLGMCDNQAFPFWSDAQSLLVSFSVSAAGAATPRREFVISYVAVPPGP